MKRDPNLLAEQALRSILKRLRLVRRARGISQAELAKLLGISQNAYCRIENGQRELSLQRYIVLAAVLGVPPNELLDGSGSKVHVLMSRVITHQLEGDGQAAPTKPAKRKRP
jgi:transcriptional regulator with XRE-family HTH domain